MTTREIPPAINLSAGGTLLRATFVPPIPVELIFEATIPDAIIKRIVKSTKNAIASIAYIQEIPGHDRYESAKYFIGAYQEVALKLDRDLNVKPVGSVGAKAYAETMQV